MLYKTEKFNKKFLEDLRHITINKGYKLKGSYIIKGNNAVITDIDIQQNVHANDKLLELLVNKIKEAERNNFVFISLETGLYVEFIPPWTIDDNGGCTYNPDATKKWYDSLRSNRLLDATTYIYIENKLFKDTISLQDLIDVRNILAPFSEISWDKNDIAKGYKVVRGVGYNLLDFIRNGNTTAMRYVYKYLQNNEPEVIMVDFALVDFTHKKDKINVIERYYVSDDYKIFKTYKWYLKDEARPAYSSAIDILSPYIAIKNRIKLISKLIKFKLVSEPEIYYLMSDLNQYCKEHNLPSYSLEASAQLSKLCDAEVKKIIDHYRPLFRQYIQDEYKYEVGIYELRSKEAHKPISKKLILNRLKKGLKCPFFIMDRDEFHYIYDLCNRIIFDPEKMLKCLSLAANTFDVNMTLLIKTIFPKNNLRIVTGNDNGNNILELQNTEGVIYDIYSPDQLQELQRFILTYNMDQDEVRKYREQIGA